MMANFIVNTVANTGEQGSSSELFSGHYFSFFNMHVRKMETIGSQALMLRMAFEENFKLWEVVTSLRRIHSLN